MDGRDRVRARRVGLGGFAVALALPALLFHRLIEDIASEFRLDLGYLVAEWAPWVLIAAGLAFAVPVVWSAGRNPDSRWYPRARKAYAGWATVLYLLGMALAMQVAQISGTF
ncbi:MAG: hypothetical protein QOJ97_1138 [Solirubrobacteraceae bacterium]|jgi:hypothetical protein|nr:hypothetical protein [Solirubrobacteraceae bacterium]